MMDVVVTVPKKLWREWIEGGDLVGERWSEEEYYFTVPSRPKIVPSERVYVVAHGRLRGYAPLLGISGLASWGKWALVRGGGAVAVTIDQPIPGFQGYRYRWWPRADEYPFPDWRVP